VDKKEEKLHNEHAKTIIIFNNNVLLYIDQIKFDKMFYVSEWNTTNTIIRQCFLKFRLIFKCKMLINLQNKSLFFFQNFALRNKNVMSSLFCNKSFS
jgi:hypothetical protein